jgi:hypothetical protein
LIKHNSGLELAYGTSEHMVPEVEGQPPNAHPTALLVEAAEVQEQLLLLNLLSHNELPPHHRHLI